MNKYFDFKRFLYLIRYDTFKNYSATLIAIGAITGIIFSIDMISGIYTDHPVVPHTFFPNILFIGGFIVSSLAYRDLQDQKTGMNFMILPASIFEKFFSKFLVTNLFYIVGSIIFFYLLTLILSGLNLLLFQYSTEIFNPFTENTWFMIKIYFIVQSIFLFGSVYFRKNAFLKIIFSLFIIQLCINIYTALFGRIFLGKFFSDFHNIDFNGIFPEVFNLEAIGETMLNIVKFLFYWILAPYFWILTFLHLKETEV